MMIVILHESIADLWQKPLDKAMLCEITTTSAGVNIAQTIQVAILLSL